MPNYTPLLEKLVEKSDTKTLPWKPTFEDNTFIVALEGEVTFEITRLEDGGFEFVMKDKDGKKIIEMNSHNRQPYHRDFVDDDQFFATLARLYEAARLVALDVDKKVDVAQHLLDRF